MNPSINKQKGIHFFGKATAENIKEIQKTNLNWTTLVTWGSQETTYSPKMKHQFGDSAAVHINDSLLIGAIIRYKQAGLNVFLKPHIWIEQPEENTWRSDILPQSEEEWVQWSSSYTDFIKRYALVADKANADMFCIGTEFSALSKGRPEYWKQLIKDVRNIYKGDITYAANWDSEYKEIAFWEHLDYIGVQAYFPLTTKESSQVQDLVLGWNEYIPDLVATSEKYNKRILFTELGYKSTTDTALKPWEWIENSDVGAKSISLKAQEDCYRAFFKAIWPQDWFQGVHIWQYNDDYIKSDSHYKNLDFTPQGKPAESVISENFRDK